MNNQPIVSLTDLVAGTIHVRIEVGGKTLEFGGEKIPLRTLETIAATVAEHLPTDGEPTQQLGVVANADAVVVPIRSLHTCDECGKKYASPSGLRIHVGRAHKTSRPAADIPPPAPEPAVKVRRRAQPKHDLHPGKFRLRCDDCDFNVDTGALRALHTHVFVAHDRDALTKRERTPRTETTVSEGKA